MRIRFWSGALVALALSLLLLSACGGDDDDAPPPDGDPAPTTADNGGDDNGDSHDPAPGGGQPAEGIAGLSAGDCFDAALAPDGTIDYSSVTAAACSEPHRGEVIHVGAPDTDGAFPGDLRLRRVAREICDPAVFDEYLGAEPASGLSRQFAQPSEGSWNDGARNIICLLYLKHAQLQGSVRGVGYDIFPANFPTDAPRPEAMSLINVGSSEDVTISGRERNLLEDAGIAVEDVFEAIFSLEEVDTADEAISAIEDAIAASGWTIETTDPNLNAYVVEKDGRQLVIFSELGTTVTYIYFPE